MKLRLKVSILMGVLLVLLTACVPSREPRAPIVPEVWPSVNLTEDQIIQYLTNNRFELSEVEGIWDYNQTRVETSYPDRQSSTTEFEGVSYRVGIVKKGFLNSQEFDIIILWSSHPEWNYPGRIKGGLTSTTNSQVYQAFWHMLDYSQVSSFLTIDRSRDQLILELPEVFSSDGLWEIGITGNLTRLW